MENELIKHITKSGYKVSLAITGGGTYAFGDILSKGGCSDFFVSGSVPYGTDALKNFLGKNPSYNYCSKETAREIAVCARQKIEGDHHENSLGIGVTSSLCKVKKERVGRENKMLVCISTQKETSEYSFNLFIKDRQEQEELCSELIQICLISFCSKKPVSGFINAGKCSKMRFQVDSCSQKNINDMVDDLDHFHESLDESAAEKEDRKKSIIIYSGSFNPIHKGHLSTLNTCLGIERVDMAVLEVCTGAYGKTSVDHLSIKDRIIEISKNIPAEVPVVISDKAYFIDKYKDYSKIFPNCRIIFAIGDDVFFKISDSCKESGESMEEMFGRNGVNHSRMQFLVFPRLKDRVKFSEDQRLYICEETYDLTRCKSSSQISSTDIRKCKI